MMIARTLLRYYTLIYALLLPLFSCLTSSLENTEDLEGLGPRIGDKRQCLQDGISGLMRVIALLEKRQCASMRKLSKIYRLIPAYPPSYADCRVSRSHQI